MPATHRLSAAAGLPLSVLAGLAIPVQGRINGALGTVLQDGLAAALVSFSLGLVLMVALSLMLRAGRDGLRRVLPAVRQHRFPRWYLLAGCSGAFLVMSQGVAVSLIGIALFTVAVVTGQSLSGILVDRLGLGPAGRQTVTLMRVFGAVLTVAAVAWAVSPKFSAAGTAGTWLLPVLLPLAAGFLQSFQQALNGSQSAHYGSPLPATLINFIVGTVVLAAAWLVKAAVAGPAGPLPDQWWYYLGGPMGCVFIFLGAVLVRDLGVLLTGLGMIAGQVLGSLLLDVFFPAPGTVVAAATVLGTLLTLVAMVLATLPWRRAAIPARLRRRR
ncbi:DMT family transporter [Arthrobacter mobilis]|uniref:DMT family transporter n=1 Tax=Arthrobacter mobilis TaxID=2724944 RepID=A0A7X6K7W9_9MICC|nr:DMT family transporter [Arthrobacter mobilis]NKX56773.1 DMT family transporter [Arthrobacter mobilis]